ncbi:MAG: restriction endonuclease subunit S [Candidatus Limnocylindrales bacterium]
MPLEAVLSVLIDHRGRTPKKLGGDFMPEGVPVVSAKNVSDGRLDLQHDIRYVSWPMYERWMPERVKPGDVILTSEAPLGQVACIAEPMDLCLGQRLFGLRGDPAHIDSRFLFYALRSPLMLGRIQARATGTTAQGIRQSQLRNVEIDLPSLAEQHAIADILDQIEKTIADNEGIARAGASALRATYTRAVDIAEASHTAQTLRLGDIATENREGVDPRGLDPATPYIGLEHMPRRSIVLDRWGRADQVTSGKLRFRKGDILFGKLRPYFHKVGIALVDGICSSDILVIRAASADSFAVVLETVSASEFIAFASGGANGTRMPRTNWHDLSRYELVAPDAAVSAQLASVAKAFEGVLAAGAQQNIVLNTMRRELLPRLIGGRLRLRGLTPRFDGDAP